MSTSQTRGIFVGSQREMAVLTSVLDDALSGQGRLVMLAGEPGIGKTRTAQELASLAEAKGAQVLWGRCYEEEGTPPYWAWVQAIRSYVQGVAAYAWDEALAHFERGLVARDVTLSGTEAASDEEAAALLFGLGRARVATTEPLHPLQDALDTLRRAFDYYVDAGDVEHAVAIAEYPYFPRFGYSYGSSQLVARALSLVPSGSHAAGRLLFRYGLILGVEEGDSAGARGGHGECFCHSRAGRGHRFENENPSRVGQVGPVRAGHGGNPEEKPAGYRVGRPFERPPHRGGRQI